MFKLTRARRIQPEVRLQRDFHVDARRHVDETAARPNRSVQRGKLVVFRRHERHEIFADNVFVFDERGLHIGVDDAQIGQPLLNAVIDDLRIVLRSDARQRFFFGGGDAQPVERPLNFVGHLRPIANLRGIGLDVGDNLIHIERADVGSPSRQVNASINLQGLEAEVEHPRRVVLAGGYIANDFLGQARVGLVNRFVGVAHVIQRPFNISNVILHELPSQKFYEASNAQRCVPARRLRLNHEQHGALTGSSFKLAPVQYLQCNSS